MATAVDPTGVTTAIRIAASIATTAANLAKIGASKFQKTASTAPTPSAPSASSTPNTGSSEVSQQAPVLAQTGSTLLNPDGTVQGGQQQTMVKAVVVESDITDSQSTIKSIEEKASFS